MMVRSSLGRLARSVAIAFFMSGHMAMAVAPSMFPLSVLRLVSFAKRQVIQRRPDSAVARAFSFSQRLAAPRTLSEAVEYITRPRVLRNSRNIMARMTVAPRRRTRLEVINELE